METGELKNNEALIRALNHEIKNPLTALKGFIQLLEIKKHDPDKISEYSSIMLRQISELEKIFDDLYTAFELPSPEYTECSMQDISDVLTAEIPNLRLATENGKFSVRTDRDMLLRMLRRLTDINDVYDQPEITFEFSAYSLFIRYGKLDFSTLNSSNFFIPYASSVFFKNGSGLFEACMIASHLGIDLSYEKKENMISVKFQNV